MSYIEFKNVVKEYKMGEVVIKALDNTNFSIEKGKHFWYNQIACWYGDVAQLARAFGSYPKGRGFDPPSRYQYVF